MIVADTSVILEILLNGRLREKCEIALDRKTIVIPSLIVYETFRRLRAKISEEEALSAVAWLRSQVILPLTDEVALLAADISLQHGLAMADSFMLAHARSHSIVLYTLDHNFAGIEGVQIIR